MNIYLIPFLKQGFLATGLIFIAFLFSINQVSAQEKPLGLNEINRGLQTRGPGANAIFENRLKFIIESIRRRGVSFDLTKTDEDYLRGYGGGVELINVIRQAKKTITTPKNGTAEYYLLQGVDCDKRKDYQCSINNYTKAIELNPKFVEPYLKRGFAYYNTNQKLLSFKDINKAIEIAPNFATPKVNRAILYTEEGNYKEALNDITQAIEINPQFASAYFNRGTVNYNLKNRTQAISDLTKAIEIDPKFADAYFNRAIVYKELGETGKEQADTEKYNLLKKP